MTATASSASAVKLTMSTIRSALSRAVRIRRRKRGPMLGMVVLMLAPGQGSAYPGRPHTRASFPWQD
jgi:hypothetical protein